MTSCNYTLKDGTPQNRPKGTACVIEVTRDNTTDYIDGKCDGLNSCGI